MSLVSVSDFLIANKGVFLNWYNDRKDKGVNMNEQQKRVLLRPHNKYYHGRANQKISLYRCRDRRDDS